MPHLKSIFDLSYARVMLIQFAFFSAYFLFSMPWSRIVNRIGYQGAKILVELNGESGVAPAATAMAQEEHAKFCSAFFVGDLCPYRMFINEERSSAAVCWAVRTRASVTAEGD